MLSAEIRPKSPEDMHKLAVVTAVNSTLETTQQMLERDDPNTAENNPQFAEASKVTRASLENLMTQLLEIRELVSKA